MEDKKSFVLYADYEKHLELLSNEECGILFKSIFKYKRTGTIPVLDGAVAMAFSFIRLQMDRDADKYNKVIEKRREAGKKGGRPPKGPIEEKTKKANGFFEKQTKAKKAVNGNEDGNEDGNENEINNIYINSSVDSPHPSPKIKKHKYGEYKNVLLSDEELEKLKIEFPDDYIKRIDNLSEYIESSGKKYKSHFATIRKWSKKDAVSLAKEKTEIKYGGTYL